MGGIVGMVISANFKSSEVSGNPTSKKSSGNSIGGGSVRVGNDGRVGNVGIGTGSDRVEHSYKRFTSSMSVSLIFSRWPILTPGCKGTIVVRPSILKL